MRPSSLRCLSSLCDVLYAIGDWGRLYGTLPIAARAGMDMRRCVRHVTHGGLWA